MNIRNLIELLPPIFKSNDTYKVNGRGFLERYLEICGSYLTDIITPDIDNILDIISIDTTPKEYLNYLWEFLGEIPFANIYNIDSDKWALYYDGTDDKEELWLNPNYKPILLNDQTARDLIKYSLSLYKIRGTREFFDIMLGLYGLEYSHLSNTLPSYNEVIPHMDVDRLDYSSLDKYYTCGQCGTVVFDIDDSKHQLVFADKNGVIIMGSDDRILIGRSLYINPSFDYGNGELEYFDLKHLVTAYNNYQGQIDFSNLKSLPADVRMFVILRKTLESFFDRFTPYNAKIHLTYSGISVDDNIQFDVLYEDPNKSILSEDNKSVGLKVESSSKWPVYYNRYQISGNTTDWSGEYHSSNIIKINTPGTYYFKLSSSDNIIPVTVGISRPVSNVSLEIRYGNIIVLDDPDTMGMIAPIAKLGSTQIDSTVVFPDGTEYIAKPNQGITVLDPGRYKVYVTDYPMIYTTVWVYSSLTDNPGLGKVHIPYGIQITYKAGTMGGTSTIGGPEDVLKYSPIAHIPIVSIDDYESQLEGEILDIRAWLIDPNTGKVLWDDEFLESNKFISIAHRVYFPDVIEPSLTDIYKTPSIDGTLVSMALTKEEAIDFIHKSGVVKGNIGRIESYSASVLITLHQSHISKYYSQYRIDQQTNQPRFLYLHNPLFVNMYHRSGSGNVYIDHSFDSSGNNLTITNKSSLSQDVVLFGAILIDNRLPITLPVWVDGRDPKDSFDYPRYVATATLAAGSSKPFDISDIKFKDNLGNTIRRAIVAMGRTNYELTDTGIFISDTVTEDSSLTLDILNGGSNLSVKDGPIEVTTKAGTNIKVHKVYTLKLNHGKGIDYIKFKPKVVINGIYYDDTDIVIDDTGNTYNTKSIYLLSKVRYTELDSGTKVNGGGYILSVPTLQNVNGGVYNVLLNLEIDPESTDYSSMVLNIVPDKFYLPSNGTKAIVNAIAVRPYDLGRAITIVENTSQHSYTNPAEIIIDGSNIQGSNNFTFTAKTEETNLGDIQKSITVIKN